MFQIKSLLIFVLSLLFCTPQSGFAQGNDPRPPDRVIKLIFVHHSCGENWLADGHGNLGRALGRNNYFVSDTNYGWGPEGIGDRTDIPDWPEWFIGPQSRRYLRALYRESGKNSPFKRTGSDPGGENRIVMFKSCFPNSDLEGRPNDPPAPGDGLTVGNAKAIYNALLRYFSSRPDKLFIAVTAPPLQDSANAANARAFNTWLVNDWLSGYTGDNVAVFDFYNVLTGPKNHHRCRDNRIEHTREPGRDTLYYPTNGDDHPSPAGNRKATKEFIPLLNVAYNRWIKGAPGTPLPKEVVTSVPVSPQAERTREKRTEEKGAGGKRQVKEESAPEKPEPLIPGAPGGNIIDDFESGAPQWAVFSDEGKKTLLTIQKDPGVSHGGKASLCIAYRILPDSWATCSLVYPAPRKWGRARGLTLFLHAERAGQEVAIVAYQGNTPDNLSHFEFRLTTQEGAVRGWQKVDIPWNRFRQAAWEGDGKTPFDPSRAMGIAFAFDTAEGQSIKGRLWVDDVRFLK